MTTNVTARSPWLTVLDMLITNRCWLCASTFQRGHKKKVFLVSQLISSLTRLSEDVASGNLDAENAAKIKSANYSACYMAFTTELDSSASKLANELQKHDVAPWLSGLVCCRSQECADDYALLVPLANSGNSIETPRPPAYGVVCPPDCGCDNPWPFLTA